MVKPIEVQLTQGSKEWLEFRKSHIMASDTPKIMGVSKWGTPLSCYKEKIEGLEQEDNIHMKYGRELEPEALSFIEQLKGISLKPKVFISGRIPYLGASLDAVNENNTYGYEIKCLSTENINKAIKAKISLQYIAQIQKQMFVMEWDRISILFYKSATLYHLIEIERDEKFIEKILKAEVEFWNRLVNLSPPPPLDSDYSECEDPTFITLATEYIELDNEIKLLESKKMALKGSIIDLCGGISTKGGGIKVRRSNGRQIINWKGVQEKFQIHENDLKEFTSQTKDSWAITIHA